MSKTLLNQHFTGVAAKRLSATEVDPNKSNQHEFNGFIALKRILGEEAPKDFPATLLWLDDAQGSISEEITLTWYDSRRKINQCDRQNIASISLQIQLLSEQIATTS